MRIYPNSQIITVSVMWEMGMRVTGAQLEGHLFTAVERTAPRWAVGSDQIQADIVR